MVCLGFILVSKAKHVGPLTVMYLTKEGMRAAEEDGEMNKAGEMGIRAGKRKVWLRRAILSI